METEQQIIKKYLERLRGYGCGKHKQLEKQMLNRLTELDKRDNDRTPKIIWKDTMEALEWYREHYFRLQHEIKRLRRRYENGKV